MIIVSISVHYAQYSIHFSDILVFMCIIFTGYDTEYVMFA